MSGVRLRSGKRTGKAGIVELKPKEKSKVTKEEPAMNDAILEELKSLRSYLTKQMQIISDELAIATFKNTTDARLAKIENVISKIDEIDQLKPKVEKLEEDVGGLKESVNTTLNETEKLFQECNVELKRRVERLERYSRDFNIRVLGVAEEDGENCLTIIQDYFTLLGFQDDIGEIENVHRTGKKRDGKPRQIIAKLYSRPFKREFLRVAKSPENKEALNGIRFVEDFTPYDFETRKKSTPNHERGFRQRQEGAIYKRKAFHRR